MIEPPTSEVRAAEQQADAAMANTVLPSGDQDYCRWHLLTVAEDLVRLQFVGGDSRFDFVTGTLQLADNLKYSLKHCLALTRRLSRKARFPFSPTLDAHSL